jgi:hypothetical protein
LIDKHAYFFANALSALVEFKYLCAELSKVPDQPLTEPLRNLANHASHQLRVGYILSEMGEHLGPLDRFDRTVNPAPGHPIMPAGVVGQEVKHLVAGVRDLLEQHFYFHVDLSDVPLYMGAEPFGERVSLKFPKAIEDIAEGAKCLALQRSTAAVFHLMRAMEIGVRTLGRKLKVSINVEVETWYQIMEHVDGAIRKLPAKTAKDKSRKAKLAAASANLNAVRIAQRNEVMHPKQTYTREEAHEVYRATRLFMDHLAGLV